MAATEHQQILSTDSHVIEPPDLWDKRMARRFAGRGPRLVAEDDADWWYADGQRLQSVSGGADTGVRFLDQTKLRMSARMAEVRPGAFEPMAKLADMDLDGVAGEVLYPTLGLQLWRLGDSQLLSAIFAAYNDWIAEFCATDPGRLVGVACVLPDDVAAAVIELRRAAGIGLRGALIPVHLGEERGYDDPIFEPLWEAAEELAIPLSLHVGTNRTAPGRRPGAGAGASDLKFLSTPTRYATAAHWVSCSISDMIFAGVFEHHPGLRVVSLEHELAWALHLLQTMDYVYSQRARRTGWHRFPEATVPSDYFRRNVSLSFQEDRVGVDQRAIIGVPSLVWGSDYPHHESTFPRSRQILGQLFEGVADVERDAILRHNPSRLYGFA